MTQVTRHRLSRRRFLKSTGIGLLGLYGGRARYFPDFSGQDVQQVAEFTSRVILHSYDPAAEAGAFSPVTQAVRDAMLAATDLSWLHEGETVFVKVASNSNIAPPAVTSPAVLEGVIGLLWEAGAGRVIVGDMSGAQFVRHLPEETIGSTRENLRQNGLLQAAEAAGAEIHCFEEVPFSEAFIPAMPPGAHHWGTDLQVAAILDEVDHIINLPRLGKHGLAGASLGLKNAVGWISDYSRGVLHRDAATFHAKIAEINAIPQLVEKMRLTLTLVDGALTTYGPDAGYRLGLARPFILAAEDVVCHDQVALVALAWARQQTPAAALAEDPYPAESNGLNWWFVRVYWGEEAASQYETLPTFDLVSADQPTHVNLAWELLHGGRPAALEVIPGGVAPDDSLLALLAAQAALGITLPASL
ncbi:MAG: DUF362 domain-containing protein [Anaerolineae bacterium]|nr:DUF362 domain-containing protein [Anaerolineae bacterium]